MPPRRRKLASVIALVLVLAGWLTACGDGGDAPSGTPAAEPTRPSASSSSTSPPAASGSRPSTPVAVPDVAPPEGATVDAPDSIASDCSEDVTAGLNAWLASVPDDSTMRLAKDGCYTIGDPVQLVDRARVVLDGNGAEVRASGTGSTTPGTQPSGRKGEKKEKRSERGRVAFSIQGGHDIVVRDLAVQGSLPDGSGLPEYDERFEAQHGFQIVGARDVRLDHVSARNVRGDFVYIGKGSSEANGEGNAVPSEGITVVSSTFDRSGRQGIAITYATRVLVQGNRISNAARSMFDLEPNEALPIRDVRIIGNVTGAARNFWLSNKAGAAMDIGDVTVADNVMDAPTGGLVFVYGNAEGARGPFTFTDNRFETTNEVHDEGQIGGFFFQRTNDITISGNHVTFPAGDDMPAVELRSSDHVTISANDFEGNGEVVLKDSGSQDVTVD